MLKKILASILITFVSMLLLSFNIPVCGMNSGDEAVLNQTANNYKKSDTVDNNNRLANNKLAGTQLTSIQMRKISQIFDDSDLMNNNDIQGIAYNEFNILNIFIKQDQNISSALRQYLQNNPKSQVVYLSKTFQTLKTDTVSKPKISTGLTSFYDTSKDTSKNKPTVLGGEGIIMPQKNTTSESVCSIAYSGFDKSTGNTVIMSAGHCTKSSIDGYKGVYLENSQSSPALGGIGGQKIDQILSSSSSPILYSRWGTKNNGVGNQKPKNITEGVDFMVAKIDDATLNIEPKITKWGWGATLSDGDISKNTLDVLSTTAPIKKSSSVFLSGRTSGFQVGSSIKIGSQWNGIVNIQGDNQNGWVYGFGAAIKSNGGDSGGSVLQNPSTINTNSAAGILSGGGQITDGKNTYDITWASNLQNSLDKANNRFAVNVKSPTLNEKAFYGDKSAISGTAEPESSVCLYFGDNKPDSEVFTCPKKKGYFELKADDKGEFRSKKIVALSLGNNDVYLTSNTKYSHSMWTKQVLKVNQPVCKSESGKKADSYPIVGSSICRWKIPSAKKVASFTDIKISHSLNKSRQNAIKWFAKMGISICVDKKGREIKKCAYKPQTVVNKGAMAEFIWKLWGKPEMETSGSKKNFPKEYSKKLFTKDKQLNKLKNSSKRSDNGRYLAVQYLATKGVFGKVNKTTLYKPTAQVDRLTMAKWLYNLAGKPRLTQKQILKAKTLVHDSSDMSIYFLVINQITIPTSDYKFNPTNLINRGSMAELLQKFYVNVAVL